MVSRRTGSSRTPSSRKPNESTTEIPMNISCAGALPVILALGVGAATAAQPPAVLTTFGDGDIAVVLAHPDAALPAPAQATASGFGVATRPHGLDFVRVGEALV